MDENLTKLKLIDEFYLNFKQIFKEYVEKLKDINGFRIKINKFFDSWNFCRLDLINRGDELNHIKILGNNSNINVKYPSWFGNGRGCVIQSKQKVLNLELKCIKNGMFNLFLKGIDFRNKDRNRIPIYVIFEKLIVNDSLIFKDNKICCHDEQYIYKSDCIDSEIFKIQIEFKTIFDFFPKLLMFQSNFNKSNNLTDIKNIYNLFEEYILQQKFFIGKSDNYERFIFNEFANLNNKVDDLLTNYNQLSADFKDYEESTHEIFSLLFLNCEINTKGILKDVQILSQELLNFIVNVCEKYKLTYWLDFGTLLGAIRHEGFIPWDDDIDIGMFRCDIKKFLEVINYELKINKLDKFVTVNLDRKFKGNLISFIQIFYSSGYLLGAVDIFPYDFIHDISKNSESIFLKERKKFRHDVLNGISREIAEEHYFKKLNISRNPQNYIIEGVDGLIPDGFFLIENNDMFPLKICYLNGKKYWCPNNFDKYLTKKYGSYKDMPKKIKTHSNRINAIKSDQNIQDLSKHISLLQSINKNFK